MKHVSSSERSKVFQALLFSKEVSHARFHFQRRVIKIVFYVGMFKKRNRPNPIVQTHSCTILWCALHACNCLATGCLFSSCYWRPVRGISQTQNRKGQGRSKIKQWREIAMLYILQENCLIGYLFCMRKLPIVLLC